MISTQMKNTFYWPCWTRCPLQSLFHDFGVNTNWENIVRIRCVYRKKQFVEFGLMVIIKWQRWVRLDCSKVYDVLEIPTLIQSLYRFLTVYIIVIQILQSVYGLTTTRIEIAERLYGLKLCIWAHIILLHCQEFVQLFYNIARSSPPWKLCFFTFFKWNLVLL